MIQTPRQQVWAYDHFAEFVRKLLVSRSAAQVAFRAGVDKSTIVRIANGRPPLLATAKAIIDSYTVR